MEKLSKRDIRRLAKILLQEYEKAIDKTIERLVAKTGVVNSMGNPREPSGGWWARGDLNPGPPPCEGGVLTRLDDGPTLLHDVLIVSYCSGVNPLRLSGFVLAIFLKYFYV